MNEHEQQLRKWIRSVSAGGGPLSLELAEACLYATLSCARAEALEEAEEVFVEWGTEPASPTKRSFQERIRALITTPAPATIPVERVREVLEVLCNGDTIVHRRDIIVAIANQLSVALFPTDRGVDLDGKEKRVECSACIVCGRQVMGGICVECGVIGSECACGTVRP